MFPPGPIAPSSNAAPPYLGKSLFNAALIATFYDHVVSAFY